MNKKGASAPFFYCIEETRNCCLIRLAPSHFIFSVLSAFSVVKHLRPDPLPLLGEEIDEEILAEVLGSGVEGPAVVQPGDLLDELQQVGVLAEHEDIQADAAGSRIF